MQAKAAVAFDTNIYISAIIFGGNPRQCLELARSGEIELIVSKAVYLELAEKLRDKFDWPEEDIAEVVTGISGFAKIATPRKKVALIKADPDDNMILEIALETKIDYIISEDKKHLLSLKKFEGVPIISAKEFLDIFYGKN